MLLSVISETDKITKALHFACANVASQLSVQADADGLPTQQMFEIFHNAVEKVYGSIQASESSRPILYVFKHFCHHFIIVLGMVPRTFNTSSKNLPADLKEMNLINLKLKRKGFHPSLQELKFVRKMLQKQKTYVGNFKRKKIKLWSLESLINHIQMNSVQ